MKKLFLLLTLVGMIFTACESGGGVEEENGGGTPFIPEIKISPTTLTYSCNGGEQMVNITANFEYEIAEQSSWITIEQTDKGLVVIVDANKNTTERSAFVSVSNSKYDINKSIEVRQEGFVPKIELAEQSIEVEFEPAEYFVDVTSPYSWKAASDNDWIVIETKTGIAGTETLKFSVARNEEEEIRKGTITLKNSDYNLVAELYVIQKSFTPSIVIEPEALSFTVEGGEQNIAVTANFEYEISTSADWVSYKKTEKGLTITVPNNKEVEERSAVVTISSEKYKISKTIKVAQGAFVPEITIDTEIIEFAAKSGAKDVAITANFEYEVSTSASWVTYSKKQNGITVSVPNYGIIGERTANITISSGMYNISKTIKIRQKGLTEEEYAEQRLVYTSSDGMVVTPNKYFFGANVVSNTYKNGQGVILFDAPITYIGEYAFYRCYSLTSVTIPDSVTSIGDYAFYYCTSLTSVTIGNSVTSIGGSAFYNCKSLTSVTIPDSVTSIGEETFRYCSSLTSVTIPNSVTSIGYSAFSGCTSLTSVTIPDSVTSIGDSAFYNCTSLTSVTIPDSVTSIGKSAFYECTSLTSVTIPNSVTSIGEETFRYCSSLTSVTIPNSVTSIERAAFRGCTSLTSITIPDSVTSIGEDAFASCSSLTSVTIGNSVTSIGEDAFYGCTSLTNVTIGNGVTSIGNKAFYGCTGELIINSKIIETDYTSNNYPTNSSGWLYGSNFTKLTIGNNITKIGSYAFAYCKSLTSVTIGNNVTSIGKETFRYCSSLTSVTIPDSVTSIGDYAFYYCTSLTSVTIPNSVTSIGECAFYDCTSLTSVTIPNSVTSIGECAFYDCTSLTSVTIPNSVTSIGDCAFYYCTSLTSVTIPNSVTSIGYSAFSGCTSLTSVTIPDSVTSIGEWAFRSCTSLTSVTIPNSVTSIGDSFYYCTSLTSVYCKPTTPPAGSSSMFSCNASDRKIYVPRASVSAYKSASYWSDYSSDIVGYDF